MKKFENYVFTERLRKMRKIKGYTVKQMADLLNKESIASYSNIENGVVEPRIVDINTISETLGLPADYFFNIKTGRIYKEVV